MSVKILVSDPVHAMITARQQVMRAELGRTVTMSEVIEDLFRLRESVRKGQVTA